MDNPTAEDLLDRLARLQAEIDACFRDLDGGWDSDNLSRSDSVRVGRAIHNLVSGQAEKAVKLCLRYGFA